MLDSISTLLAEGSGPAGLLTNPMVPVILMFAVFYFLVMRPMKKQEEERKQRLSELKRGDKIVLSGGILGRVSKVEDDIVLIEVADKVKLRVLKKEVSDFQDTALAKAKEESEAGAGGGGLLASLFGGGGASSGGDKDSKDSKKA